MIHVRNAARQLTRHPAVSIIIVVMLAVAIGGSTAIFSLFHELLLRPLPVPDPERLVNLDAPGPKPGSTSCGWAGDCQYVLSYPMFRDLEAGQRVFSGIAAHHDFDANLAHDGATVAGGGLLVSGGYFSTLNLSPALGRLIGPGDDARIGASPVVVLRYGFWRDQLGADENVLGRTLTVNGQPLEIIGVAPEGFDGTTIGFRPDVFVPLTLHELMRPTGRPETENRRAYWLYAFARLAPGVSVQEASASINVLYSGILNDVEAPLQIGLSSEDLERFRNRRLILEPGARGQSWVPEGTAQPFTLLLGVTALVLLIVCANVANLLLARGVARSGEMAIRASIGAARRHLVAQLLTEAGALAVIGGALSLPVAAATLQLVAAIAPPEAAGIDFELDRAAMLFGAGVALGTVLLFGSVPALRAARTDPGAAIKGRSAQAGAGRGLVRFRGTLATLEIGLSIVLLVLAGLFTQSLMNIGRIDLGLDVESVVTFTVSPRLNGYEPERVMGLFDRIEEALAAQPGVTSVGSSAVPLLTNSSRNPGLKVEGFDAPYGTNTNAAMNEVSPGFFATLSIPFVAGRGFTDADRLLAPRVAVVNESFVRKFGLGGNALGSRFGFDFPGSPAPDIEIVGVVRDTKYSKVKAPIPPQFFLPRLQSLGLGTLTYYVRGAVEPAVLMGTIRRVVAGIDPNLPVDDVATMQRHVRDNVFLDRFVSLSSASLAALATFLAAVGLYGVLAYNVAQRTRELSLRIALGAEPGRLRRMVLKQVGIMGLVGGTLGLAAALGLGRAAEALLYGVSGYDPRVLAAAAAVLAVVVLAASYLPARRASNVAPMEALRHE
ncbi:MAG TPA: ABC transporter permease [Gammaproteobacteria bacterium]